MTRRVSGLTQTARVKRLLDQRGRQGLTAVDFAQTPTADGGPPILRVAARVNDLKNQGYDIRTCGERDKCAVYVWGKFLAPAVSVEPVDPARSGVAACHADNTGSTGSTDTAPSLFDPPAARPQNAIWEDADAA